MSGIKYFSQNYNVENKSVIIRLDLNVPVKEKIILDHTKILQTVPFLENLVKKKAKVVVISHMGRPAGIKNNELSLTPVYKFLKEKINTNIYFFTGSIDNETKKKISHLKSGEIILFENIRFSKGENENEEGLAKTLASLGEIYINDAFSCSHRKQASIHKITQFVKESYAGPQLKKEVQSIDFIIKDKKKPVTCVIGGSKVSTKINIILNLIKNVNNIIIVGAMANNFLIYKGYKIGKSLVEMNSKHIINDIYSEAEKKNCKIIIPIDCVVSKSFQSPGQSKEANDIEKDEIILDIGPKTIKIIESVIDQSNTVLWNGPAGYFENQDFAAGTNLIAKKISENTVNKSLISILGGGDTISAINKIEKKLSFTHLSTAGGAFLEYLEGKDLPGLSVLK